MKLVDNRIYKECGECGTKVVEKMELGERPDWESRTAYICFDCIEEAYNKFKLARSIKGK